MSANRFRKTFRISIDFNVETVKHVLFNENVIDIINRNMVQFY